MARTLLLLVCLFLLSSCTRPGCPASCRAPSDVPTQHCLLVTTTRMEASEEGPQVLIEAMLLSGSPRAIARLGGEPHGPGVRLLHEEGPWAFRAATEGLNVLQMPSVVTRSGEEAVIEIADDASSMRLRANPRIAGAYTALDLDYTHRNPDHAASAALTLPDRASVIVISH